MTRQTGGPDFAVIGRLDTLTDAERARLCDRGRATDPAVAREVAALLEEVRTRGDAALRAMAARFDGVELEAIEVPRTAWDAALDGLDPAVRDALCGAADAIAAFHRAQLPAPLEVEVRPGVRLGRRAEPLGRVGVYAPGGRAAYPSSVLMGVVPARVAGVGQVSVCSPPGPDGRPAAAVLAACALAGADRVFALGGAGAIAALAYGTETVAAVDRIVGPGNAYVTEAKRQLTGVIGIDCPAGPSEVLVLADATGDPELAAAELLAQAEHDPDAAALLVTTEPALPGRVRAALAAMLEGQPRRDIIERALRARGGLLVAPDLAAAVEFANAWAPEHLLLLVRDPAAVFEEVRCAGTTFLGPGSSVAFGDYTTGANHVLPTAGQARVYAGLSTLDFLRWSTVQIVSADAARTLAEPTAVLAEAEGLPGHALAARLRAGPVLPEDGAARAPRARPPFARRAYRELATYDPGRVPTDTDLSDNTNLFGPPPAAAAALARLDAARITRYPSVYANELRRAFARVVGVDPENVTTGCGSDDVIDSALRAFCEPGEAVAYAEPTFGMVRDFARMNAATPLPVPLAAGFTLDADALLATGAAAVYLCRPNNPTGTLFDGDACRRVVREARGLVLIDEAYADFAGDDLLDAAMASDRAVVLRTMSKAHGLAGLRVGFAVGPAPLIAEIEKSRGPYKVGGAAEAAALAMLGAGRTWVVETVARTIENRERLARELAGRGLTAWPSAANFLLVRVPAAGRGARPLADALRSRGVQVRPFAALPGAAPAGDGATADRSTADCIRVSVGPWPMLERFLTALDAVLDAGGLATERGFA
jgi:histidinol dehydrogenase